MNISYLDICGITTLDHIKATIGQVNLKNGFVHVAAVVQPIGIFMRVNAPVNLGPVLHGESCLTPSSHLSSIHSLIS